MSDRILGVLAMLVAGAMAAAAWGYAAPFEYEPVGPRAFPLLLASGMAACGAWLAFKSSRPMQQLQSVQIQHVALIAIAVLIYALLFQWLGFVLATALMTIPIGRVFGASWLKSIVTGVLFGVILFVLFDKFLDVVLPWGVLKGLSSLGM